MTISLVGLAPLYSLGLKSFIEKYFPANEVTIASDAAHDLSWQSCDVHIVSATALATFARFFMPRLSNVLLLSMSPTLSSEEVLPTLSPLASYDDIRNAMSRLMDNSTSANAHGIAHPAAGGRAINAGNSHPTVHLTPREHDVLRLTARGASAKEMSAELGISVNTVLTHRKNITEKLGVHSAPALVYFAMTHGLV